VTLDLKNLDQATRNQMVAEIQADRANGLVYHSKYLTHDGRLHWDNLLLEAAEQHDSAWLAQQMVEHQLVVPEILTQDKRGFTRRTPMKPEDLADSEFNRYYIRGLCRRAIEEHIPQVITYRAKPVRNPSSEVGIAFDPAELLLDLRNHRLRTRNAVPSNPNSGISVRLPE
jgi:hypothetical protein